MKRRQFIAGLGSAAAWPLAARAQQPAMPVVGLLYSGAPDPTHESALRKGLSEAGYVEGRSVAIEERWAHNESGRLPELAADLVRRRASVIATLGGPRAALAAKGVTATIPIVFEVGSDPVQSGLVASFNRPGANVTGVSILTPELGAKRLGLLHDLVPGAARFAVLVNPSGPNAERIVTDLQSAASAFGRQIEVFHARNGREIDTVFASLVQKRVDALLVTTTPLFDTQRVQLVTLATRHAMPAIYFDRRFAEVGGLMSYGPSYTDQLRQVGIYVGRILKGEKPADLPVIQPTKFEFVINLQTARALGIEVPPTLLATADEVID